ncbi:MAG: hypothetical protein LC792_05340 [Actinobacteria bacterium]|nr:hypothetical protein [Actinomycetota bacterium]
MFRSVAGGAALALAMLTQVAAAGAGTISLTATAADGPAAPEPPQVSSHAAGTWGACGSWWSETRTQTESGSVCGVDGAVTDNGQLTQLAEPLIQVTRYVCVKRTFDCSNQNYSGTVRRSEMTVDPLLRRATIRGSLGGCALDVEFAALGPAQPQGGLSENWGAAASTPTVSLSGNQTFTSQATWWGGVCGRTVVSGQEQGHAQGQAWMFRGAEAGISGFGQDGCQCCECGE